MEASVWITLPIEKSFGASMRRCTAETIPVVTVRVKPKGLPMAITGSPTCASEESPSGIGATPLASSGSILSTARSVSTSRPWTLASISLLLSSSKLTVTLSEPATTWALVRIVPSSSTRNPEPVAVPPPPSPKGESELTPWACTNTTPRPSSSKMSATDLASPESLAAGRLTTGWLITSRVVSPVSITSVEISTAPITRTTSPRGGRRGRWTCCWGSRSCPLCCRRSA